MKLKGVDDWLKHWLKLQDKSKRPLTLRNPSEPQPNNVPHPHKGLKGKGKQRAEVDDADSDGSDGTSDDAAVESENCNKGRKANQVENARNNGQSSGSGTASAPKDANADPGITDNAPGIPTAPGSVSRSKDSRKAFFESLSDAKNYLLLIRLLLAAKVCQYSEQNCPD